MPNRRAGNRGVTTDWSAPWDQEFITRLARALHRRYRRNRLATGNADPGPWDALPAALRDSNLDNAAHIQAKLTAVNCRAERGRPKGDDPFEFTKAEVDQLARMEHDRWVAERLDSGWTLGPRNSDQLTTPSLVPWEELTDEMRDLDRMFVLAIPEVLRGLGLVVLRCDDVT